MLGMMQSGRFKVMRHLNDWWEEFRLYHRKDGKVVKVGDDLMAATRYFEATCVRDTGLLKPRDHFRMKRWATGEGRNYSWMGY